MMKVELPKLNSLTMKLYIHINIRYICVGICLFTPSSGQPHYFHFMN